MSLTPRDAIRETVRRLRALRAQLLIRAQHPAVREIDDLCRLLEFALQQRGTGKVPAADEPAE